MRFNSKRQLLLRKLSENLLTEMELNQQTLPNHKADFLCLNDGKIKTIGNTVHPLLLLFSSLLSQIYCNKIMYKQHWLQD